jgi:hypothetical protein
MIFVNRSLLIFESGNVSLKLNFYLILKPIGVTPVGLVILTVMNKS